MGLTHVDNQGSARMVDVGHKEPSLRKAKARAMLRLSKTTMDMILNGSLPKGDALAVARVAGIMAAKRVPDLIPLCHPLPLSSVQVDFWPEEDGIIVEAIASTQAPTGVEMEAMTAVSIAALTLYDMVKAVEKEASIEQVALLMKSGGKSGLFER